MSPRAIMIQGTSSDAGKSFVSAGLCRWLVRRGVRVAPFKPQNMALNSVVTVDGGEIGRAQAVQARACRLDPHTDMNPVLLKPNTDVGVQVIIHGHAVDTMGERAYHDYKRTAREAVMASWRRLTGQYDVVVVEGAGSPAEINLRDNDIANMDFAEAADCPVLLVADIDRGGVFANIVGTLSLVGESERERIRGLVINRFRGDVSLLEPGIDWLEAHTGKPVLGVLPYLRDLHLEAEDGLPLEALARHAVDRDGFRVVVPLLPRISNHTDFDPLRLHPGVDVRFVGPGQAIPPADLLVLPGSKSVRSDLEWLRAGGWDRAIARHLRFGGKVIGVCGGFQMLGRTIHDPRGIEGAPGSATGLGYLDFETTIETGKQLRNVAGRLLLDDVEVTGYEIHAGVCTGAALASPVITLEHGPDGAMDDTGQVLGTYLHGVFEHPAARDALLRWAGMTEVTPIDYDALREASLERLADLVAKHLDTARIESILGL